MKPQVKCSIVVIVHKNVFYREHTLMSCFNPYKPNIPFFGTYVNSADPDQMSQNAASDQGLHCLLTGMSIRNRLKMKSTPNTHKIGNGFVQLIRMDRSTRHIWVTGNCFPSVGRLCPSHRLQRAGGKENTRRTRGKNGGKYSNIPVNVSRKLENDHFNGLFKQSCVCSKSYDNFHGGDVWKFYMI